jgi:putative acetyltransferase
LRRLDATTAEIKRMFVLPERRGSGAAAAVLAVLEADARVRGWTLLRLETGTRQPEAVAFYTRHGYQPIPNFGSYAGSATSLCFERALV